MAFRRNKLLFLATLAILTSCHQKGNYYTIVISLDAFRWDYLYTCNTPNLNEIASNGVSCVMEPSYPASTFPNHYTIATGLFPDHHGIVNGSFWDPDTKQIFSMGDSLTRFDPHYYLGEPIWVTAEKNGIKTACIYWVGSDVPIKGIMPSYYYPWNKIPHLTFEERANEVIRLLSLPPKNRPRLVMVYFDEPDETSHEYGPFAQETQKSILLMDSIIGNLCCRLHSLPHGKKINIIITSDHGMEEISKERFIAWDDYLEPSWYEHIVGTNPTNIYAKRECVDTIIESLSRVKHISVWKREDVPKVLNYGTSNRVGDIVVAPDLGWQFAATPKNKKGAHGYSPKEKSMQVSFIAFGPAFKNNFFLKEASFQNVDIYPLLAKILHIKPSKTDGNIDKTHFLIK